MPVLYIDMLIALNWLVDFVLLAATAQVLSLPYRRFRLALGGLLGGVSALAILIPPFPAFWRLCIDIVLAMMMIVVAFPKSNVKNFLKRTAIFFMISTLFSGSVSLLASFSTGEQLIVHNGKLYADLSPLSLTVFTLLSYGGLRVGEYLTRKRIPKGGEVSVTICDGGKEYIGRGLCDTGLHLREPFSGASVLIAEKQALFPFLSSDVIDGLEQRTVSPRVRWIPYRTVGGEGLLPAFRPRTVTVKRIGQPCCDISGVYVAVCDTLGRGEYEILCGKEENTE